MVESQMTSSEKFFTDNFKFIENKPLSGVVDKSTNGVVTTAVKCMFARIGQWELGFTVRRV